MTGTKLKILQMNWVNTESGKYALEFVLSSKQCDGFFSSFHISNCGLQRIKQVVHHASRLNQALSSVRGIPLVRAHITFGGHYDGPWASNLFSEPVWVDRIFIYWHQSWSGHPYITMFVQGLSYLYIEIGHRVWMHNKSQLTELSYSCACLGRRMH